MRLLDHLPVLVVVVPMPVMFRPDDDTTSIEPCAITKPATSSSATPEIAKSVVASRPPSAATDSGDAVQSATFVAAPVVVTALNRTSAIVSVSVTSGTPIRPAASSVAARPVHFVPVATPASVSVSDASVSMPPET